MADNGVAGLDSTDRQILRELQADGRISNVELAERVRLSPSPCLRRVKSLEERGYIRGYMAVLDREQVERGMYVHVMVSLTSQRQETLEEFERAVSALPEVLECYLMAGESDYLLAVDGSGSTFTVFGQAPLGSTEAEIEFNNGTLTAEVEPNGYFVVVGVLPTLPDDTLISVVAR